MPPLKNTRHEKFCHLIAKGSSGLAAYAKVYPASGKSAANSASRLLENDELKKRVLELQEAAVDDTVLTLLEIQQFLAAVAREAVGSVGPDSPLCQEYTKRFEAGGEDSPDYEVMKVKMPCKLKAVELSAKLSGFLTEKKEVAVTGLATPLELEERVRAASVLLGGLS